MDSIIYEGDEYCTRYVLGNLSSKNLYVILLNPSTASDTKHDPTSSFIKKIAFENGYNGWIILNLTPLRSAKPHLLPHAIDNDLFERNLQIYNKYIPEKSDVWLGYGDKSESRSYLQQSRKAILATLLNKKCTLYYCYGLSKMGNPYHPGYIRRQKQQQYSLSQFYQC